MLPLGSSRGVSGRRPSGPLPSMRDASITAAEPSTSSSGGGVLVRRRPYVTIRLRDWSEDDGRTGVDDFEWPGQFWRCPESLPAPRRTVDNRSRRARPRPERSAPAITVAPFGKVDDTPVQLYTLTNKNGLVAKITNYGAIVTELHVPDRNGALADIVLGFDSLDGYVKGHPYFGAIVGRVANRIRNAEFTLEGKRYTLEANDKPHHLHGGRKGWDKVVWSAMPIDTAEGPALELTYVSKDGEEGYPGTVTAKAVYTLTNDNELKVEMQATTDKTTLVNMAHHSYWNLGGHNSGTILDHELTLYADQYTPGHADGSRRPRRSGQGHALRLHRRQADRQGSEASRRLTDRLRPQLRRQRRAESVASGGPAQRSEVRQGHDRIQADQPGVQFYTGNFLDGSAGQGRDLRAIRGTLSGDAEVSECDQRSPWRDQVIVRPGEVTGT